MKFEADYYNGLSPVAKKVQVTVEGEYFLFSVTSSNADGKLAQENLRVRISDCHVQARLGSGKRLIDLPDDSRLETDYQTLEDCLPKKPASHFWKIVHYAETHKSAIAASFVGIILSAFILLKYGVPLTAKYAAIAIPASVEQDLGKQTMKSLDNEQYGYFSTSELSIARQDEIKLALDSMCKKTANCPEYHLNFRKSPVIGANAFALPGGEMVITDELIALSKSNDEIISVLAHELGHVKGRHALRQVLQGTVSGLIIVAVTGDVSSVASGLPALMMTMSYTRDLENEADDYSLQSLKTACIPTKSFATMLMRLEASMGGEDNSSKASEMLSSHPNTKSRVMPFLKEQPACNN
ncbi:MAG: M48 family metallopeptidase [Methylophilaceae bacterium]